MVVELIGIIATVFIVVAFSMDGEKKIRILDLVGAVLFVIYGLLIKSFSTCLLNLILVGVQIYKLVKLQETIDEERSEIDNVCSN